MSDSEILESFKTLFFEAQSNLRAGFLKEAVQKFAAAEAKVPTGWVFERFVAKGRRGACLISLSRWEEALGVFEDLVVDAQRLPKQVEDRLSDEISTAYWCRVLAWSELGRLAEACDAMPEFIERVGTGQTIAQRRHVAHMYLILAEFARSQGDFGKEARAVNAAVSHCKRFDEPGLAPFARSAQAMRLNLARDTGNSSNCKRSQGGRYNLLRRR